MKKKIEISTQTKNSIMVMVKDIDSEQSKKLKSSDRKQLILRLSGIPYLDYSESLFLNELVLAESKNILKQKGQCFQVESNKKAGRPFKLGCCYSNAANKMGLVWGCGYGYVEGYVIKKGDNQKIAHAWNVDKNGKHIDFTFRNAEEYVYYGIIIPERIVYKVGEKNGYIWYAALPYIEEQDYLKIAC